MSNARDRGPNGNQAEYFNYILQQALNGNGQELYDALFAPKHTDYAPNGVNTVTINLALGNSFGLSLESVSGNTTISFTGGVIGASYTLRVVQHSAAPFRDLVYNGGGTTIHWFPTGTVPVITAANSAVDRVSIICYAANSYELAIIQDGK